MRVISVFIRQCLLEVRGKVRRQIGGRPDKTPWMKHREIDLVERILRWKRPRSCLEWGVGYGSVYFSERLGPSAVWTSVEHDRQWVDQIAGECRGRTLTVVHVPPNEPFRQEDGDGTFEQFKDYVEYPAGPYDLILIDGRARRDCLRRSFEIVADDGVVIFHDANRKALLEPHSRLFAHRVLLGDHRYRPNPLECEGGLWLGSKTVDFNKVLNLNREERLWDYYRKFGKYLRL